MKKMEFKNKSKGPISQKPFDGNYIVTVYFPKQLITTYHKQIPNKPEMNGTAEIILSDERLFFLKKTFNQYHRITQKKIIISC